jgi:cytochrome d ubiquinol oxidase subunit I
MRTDQGYSANVSAANGLFTLLGFMGLYAVLSMFYFYLMQRQITEGPAASTGAIPAPVTVSGAQG